MNLSVPSRLMMVMVNSLITDGCHLPVESQQCHLVLCVVSYRQGCQFKFTSQESGPLGSDSWPSKVSSVDGQSVSSGPLGYTGSLKTSIHSLYKALLLLGVMALLSVVVGRKARSWAGCQSVSVLTHNHSQFTKQTLVYDCFEGGVDLRLSSSRVAATERLDKPLVLQRTSPLTLQLHTHKKKANVFLVNLATYCFFGCKKWGHEGRKKPLPVKCCIIISWK